MRVDAERLELLQRDAVLVHVAAHQQPGQRRRSRAGRRLIVRVEDCRQAGIALRAGAVGRFLHADDEHRLGQSAGHGQVALAQGHAARSVRRLDAHCLHAR